MTARRWVLAGTAVAVAVLATIFVLMQWESANKVATAVSALAGLAAVGVAVWAGWSAAAGDSTTLRVIRTGSATASGGGNSNSGLVGKAGNLPDHLVVNQTGDAKASGNGDANSGIRLS